MDEDLKAGILEIKELRDKGSLKDGGIVRSLALTIREEVQISYHDALSIAESKIMERAAFKWAAL